MAHLIAARNAKKRKREMRNSHLENLRKKQKLEPVQETDNCPGIRRIADIDLIIKQLQEGCKKCLFGLIMLPESDLSDVNHLNSLMVICQNCKHRSKVKIHSDEVEDKIILG